MLLLASAEASLERRGCPECHFHMRHPLLRPSPRFSARLPRIALSCRPHLLPLHPLPPFRPSSRPYPPARPVSFPCKSRRRGGASQKLKPPRTPEPVEGRKHMDIQTDLYLEELTDVVPEADNATQTDAFLDRPPTPVFVPHKTGTDAVTQIEAGELFNFDYEVDPILEVLVGKVSGQNQAAYHTYDDAPITR